MKTLFLTNEYPPTIYGGAGVHVDYLSRELAKLMEVEVRCYGKEAREPRLDTARAEGDGLRPWTPPHYTAPKPLHSVFGAVQRGVDWNTDEHRCRPRAPAHVVHALRRHHGEAELRHPDGAHRPFARAAAPVEARAARRRLRFFLLGGEDRDRDGRRGHRRLAARRRPTSCASSTCPTSASTSSTTASTSTNTSPSPTTDALEKYGIDPQRAVTCSSSAASRGKRGSCIWCARSSTWTPGFQIVLCAGAPDTPEIAAEMKAAVAAAQAAHGQ